MIRSSQHTLKFSNETKLAYIDTLLADYQLALQTYINLIVSEELPLKTFLSSKQLSSVGNIKGGQWKQLCYKQASGIIRSKLTKVKKQVYKKYKRLYTICKANESHNNFASKKMRELNIDYMKRLGKFEIKNIEIQLDSKFWDTIQGDTFDEFIEIKTP